MAPERDDWKKQQGGSYKYPLLSETGRSCFYSFPPEVIASINPILTGKLAQ
jgi:hypothetical protein